MTQIPAQWKRYSSVANARLNNFLIGLDNIGKKQKKKFNPIDYVVLASDLSKNNNLKIYRGSFSEAGKLRARFEKKGWHVTEYAISSDLDTIAMGLTEIADEMVVKNINGRNKVKIGVTSLEIMRFLKEHDLHRHGKSTDEPKEPYEEYIPTVYGFSGY